MNCIIIEDEPLAREGMKDLVESRSELSLLAAFDSTENVMEFIKERDVKLVFLDIELPGKTGIDFARQISGDYFIIFTTAFSDYAAESYEVDAIDYLLKPIRAERFNKAVDKVLNFARLQEKDLSELSSRTIEYITVKSERRYVRIPIAEITHIEALKDYMAIYTTGKRTITRMTMRKMVEALPDEKFVRVSNSFIVNIDKVDAFDSNDLYIGDRRISIGVTYRDRISNVLGPCKS